MKFAKLIILFVFLVFPKLLFAQDEQWQFRAAAYVGIANFYFEGQNNIYKPIPCYKLDFIIEKETRLSTAINLSVLSAGGRTDYYDIRIDNLYNTASVQLKYKLQDKLAFYIGPYVGYLIYLNVSGLDGRITNRIEDLYKKSEYGIALAQSFGITKSLSIRSFQSIGLRNLRDPFFHPQQGNWIRNYSLGVGIAYRIE